MNHTSWRGSAAGFLGMAAAVGLLIAGTLSNRDQAQARDEHGGHDSHPVVASKNMAPLGEIHLYLCAFHIAKSDPKFQIEAHHYCSPQSKDVHQCVIYDSKEPGAKLLGIEYIISDDIYRTLPDKDKKYWHPHAYEILSGQLVAPDLPNLGDDIFPGLIASWGKTWHTWPDPSTALPVGAPLLMWSANGDGQIDDKLVSKRDAQFGFSTSEIRQRRKQWGYEVPQLPPPKSMDEAGRQFTETGPDKPKEGKPQG